MDTQYRPLWIIPFCIVGLLHTVFGKFNKEDLFVYGIGLFVTLTSLFFYFYFEYKDSSGLTKAAIVALIGSTGYVGLNVFVKNMFVRFGSQEGIRIFSSIIVMFSLLPIFIGIIQIPGEVLGLYEVNSFISSLFSNRYVPGRIHLTCGEPSWAARYLLVVLIFSLYLPYKGIKEFRYLLFILLVFTASSLGFLSTFFVAAIYILTNFKFQLEKLFLYVAVIIFTYLGVSNYELILFFSPYAIEKLDKIDLLIQNINFESLISLASLDVSVLARIINPIVAFDLSMKYPFGIGGESFKFWIIDCLNEYGLSGSIDDEYILSAGSTPKLMFAKILVEYGFPFTIFLIFYYLRLVVRSLGKEVLFLILSVIILTLSDDSFLFYGLLIPLCLTQNYLHFINRNTSTRANLK